MKSWPFIIALLGLLVSCAHKQPVSGVAIATASFGLMKNNAAGFPIYLTDKAESKSEINVKNGTNVYLVHTGHVLKSNRSKEDNIKNLELLITQGFDLINLSLEDFAVANTQGINLEDFSGLHFINSSVIDLNRDALATGTNIKSFEIHNQVAFIGLSDSKIAPEINNEKFIISDYVLSILKVKKEVLRSRSEPVRSFIIIHTLGSEINDVMTRLPPSFINSLAD